MGIFTRMVCSECRLKVISHHFCLDSALLSAFLSFIVSILVLLLRARGNFSAIVQEGQAIVSWICHGLLLCSNFWNDTTLDKEIRLLRSGCSIANYYVIRLFS